MGSVNASDKQRNARVVIALIASMTTGIFVLLTFENLLYPRRAQPRANLGLTALTPDQRPRVGEVEVLCAPNNVDLEALARQRSETVLAVYPDGQFGPTVSRPLGRQVRLVVVREGDARELPSKQKETLLGCLNTILDGRSADQTAVRLVAADAQLAPTDGVREFLVLKGFLKK